MKKANLPTAQSQYRPFDLQSVRHGFEKRAPSLESSSRTQLQRASTEGFQVSCKQVGMQLFGYRYPSVARVSLADAVYLYI